MPWHGAVFRLLPRSITVSDLVGCNCRRLVAMSTKRLFNEVLAERYAEGSLCRRHSERNLEQHASTTSDIPLASIARSALPRRGSQNLTIWGSASQGPECTRIGIVVISPLVPY